MPPRPDESSRSARCEARPPSRCSTTSGRTPSSTSSIPCPTSIRREHERQFPGRYVFHEALSLDVLPSLRRWTPRSIDGDHNWYTVYNELKLLADSARRDGAPLPVLVLHDVLWPYGRRDLYYSPDQIPEEYRQPYARKGMRPGSKKLLDRGGLNPTMYNALEEGGPRNGVMTGLDDFVAEHDQPLRILVLPIYFGLAIVVEEERLARQPELAAELDRLESAEGRGDLLEVAEQVRLRAMIFQHNVFFQRSEQARPGDRPLPRRREGRAARTSTTSTTRSASSS